jgi:hypothetical protein
MQSDEGEEAEDLCNKNEREDIDALIIFVNHNCKLCGHACNFIRSCTYPL